MKAIMPRLSIITFYKRNPEHDVLWVEEFMRSLMAQTSSDWELLWTGDMPPVWPVAASSGMPPEMSGRIRVFSHELPSSLPVVDRVNRAVSEYARGDLVTCVGTNDLFDERYVEYGVAALNADPEAAVWISNSGCWTDEILRNAVTCGICMIRRNVWDELGGWQAHADPEIRDQMSDWHMLMRLYARKYKAVFSEEQLFKWRRHAGSECDKFIGSARWEEKLAWMRGNL